MASIEKCKSGAKRIWFNGRDGKREWVRLGIVSMKAADHFKLRLEALIEDVSFGRPHDADLAKWLLSRPERVYARLEKSGWVGPRPDAVAVTLGNLLTAFFAGVSVKPASLVRMQQVEAALLAHFGATRDVSTLADCDAQAWRAELKSQEYAGATISRTVLYARQIFTWAMRHNLVKHNPFAFVKAGSQVNTARSCFVDQATIAKVIDAAPDAEWRLLIALSRYGGLRVPSEALALRWSDVDWANSRMTVRSSKTEHHEGGGERLVPIFSELLPFLREVFENAAAGAVYVITRYRQGCNLNPHFRRIIARAGLKPWERTWHNLRASRQTELATNYPLHTACAWIGNTKAIAAGHYLQVTDADWTRATRDAAAGAKTGGAESGATAAEMVVQKVVQHSVAPDGARSLEAGQSPANTEVRRSDATQRAAVQSEPMGRAGLERVQKPARNPHVSASGGAESGADCNDSGIHAAAAACADADLEAVVRAWAGLPAAIRAGIVAMVRAAGA